MFHLPIRPFFLVFLNATKKIRRRIRRHISKPSKPLPFSYFVASSESVWEKQSTITIREQQLKYKGKVGSVFHSEEGRRKIGNTNADCSLYLFFFYTPFDCPLLPLSLSLYFYLHTAFYLCLSNKT